MRQDTRCDRKQLAKDLEALGFSSERGGYRRHPSGVVFAADGRRPHLETACRGTNTDPLLHQLGRPGLWKAVKGENGRIVRVFDLPLAAMRDVDGRSDLDIDEEIVSPFYSLVDWALRTVDGEAPTGWRLPPRDELEVLMPSEALTVQCGTEARQGELTYEPSCLALRYALARDVREDLPRARSDWLREVLLSAQNYWQIARVGFVGDASNPSVLAEADLTGVPHSLLDRVLEDALAALKCLVQWIVRSVAFLVDRKSRCEALEVCGIRPGFTAV